MTTGGTETAAEALSDLKVSISWGNQIIIVREKEILLQERQADKERSADVVKNHIPLIK